MTDIVPADAKGVARAVAALQAGELVAFPTETVYGLGADASNPSAVRRLFAAKGRPADHPVIVHVSDLGMARAWVRDFPDDALRLAQAFWPGALTLVLPRAEGVDDVVTGGQDSVGMRVPSNAIALALLKAFGGGIAAPSANRFGHVSPTQAAHVADDLGDAVAVILDGGACEHGIESTIVAFTSAAPVLLRPGAIAVAALARVLGREPEERDAHAPRASGTLPGHYAPRTPANLVQPDALRAEIAILSERDERVGVLARTAARPDDFDGVWIDAPFDELRYAHALYAHLRTLDAANADVLLIEDVPDTPPWRAVRDRLGRATHG